MSHLVSAPIATIPDEAELQLTVPRANPVPGLYVLSTPIGNLQDLSLRALSILACCEILCCEDTRRVRRLLAHYQIKAGTRLMRYDDHSDQQTRARICARIASGARCGLLSDSGTPAIADPGMKLVRECRRQGLTVVPIPGASALTAALSVSGLPSDRVLFLGFPPRKPSQRRRWLLACVEDNATEKALKKAMATMVFFESPHRLHATLQDMASAFPTSDACILREMTKVFETHYYGSIEDLAQRLAQEKPRGEYTILIAQKKTKLQSEI